MSPTRTSPASSAVSPACSAKRAINIATFALGRDKQGGSAIALVAIDGPAPDAALAKIEKLPGVKQAKALKF